MKYLAFHTRSSTLLIYWLMFEKRNLIFSICTWATSCLVKSMNWVLNLLIKLVYTYFMLLAIRLSYSTSFRISSTHPLIRDPLMNVRAIAMHLMGDSNLDTPRFANIKILSFWRNASAHVQSLLNIISDASVAFRSPASWMRMRWVVRICLGTEGLGSSGPLGPLSPPTGGGYLPNVMLKVSLIWFGSL